MRYALDSICFDCCLPIIESLLTNHSMCINVNVFTYRFGFLRMPHSLHTLLNVAKFKWLPHQKKKNFSMCVNILGIRWAYARKLCHCRHCKYPSLSHTHTHQLTHQHKGHASGSWFELGPGPGFVSPPVTASSLPEQRFCFMTSSGEMCLQLLLPASSSSSTSLPLTWIWISRNLTSQLGWHRLRVLVCPCACVCVCVSSYFLCNERNLLFDACPVALPDPLLCVCLNLVLCAQWG